MVLTLSLLVFLLTDNLCKQSWPRSDTEPATLVSGVIHPTTSPEPMRSNLNCLNSFLTNTLGPDQAAQAYWCPLLTAFANSLSQIRLYKRHIRCISQMFLLWSYFWIFLLILNKKINQQTAKKHAQLHRGQRVNTFWSLPEEFCSVLISQIYIELNHQVKILCLEAILVLSIFQV